jgi:Family of unknown function (DUF5681)
MSTRRQLRSRSSASRAKARNIAVNEIGYGKPPRAHQFKPGRSGNSRGRSKGAKNEATILRDLLNRKIDVREDGKSRKITVFEAILLRFTEDALRGNTKTAAFLFNRYAVQEGEPQMVNDISSDDRKVLDEFLQRFEAGRKQKRQRS